MLKKRPEFLVTAQAVFNINNNYNKNLKLL